MVLKCLTKTLKIATNLVKGVKPLLSFARGRCQSKFKMSGKSWKNCRWRTCNWLVRASCIWTRVYALTTEYCGRKVNFCIKWEKYFHITCQMAPYKLKYLSENLTTCINNACKWPGKTFFECWPDSNSMMVGQFGIGITREKVRVSGASGMVGFVIIFIDRKQLDIITGSSVFGLVGIPILLLVIMQ